MVFRWTLRLLFGVFSLLVVGLIYLYFIRGNNFPISTVKVEASYQHVSREQLKSLISPYIEAGFFAVNIHQLKSRLQSSPWIESVRVARKWPQTLTIKITEQDVVARWRDDAAITTKGVIIFPEKENMPYDVPRLSGPKNQANQILKQYQNMSRILVEKGLKIAELTMSERWAWTVKLQNGLILLLGREAPIKKMKKFLKVYEQVINNQQKHAKWVDLRYPHGMAVRWEPLNHNQ